MARFQHRSWGQAGVGVVVCDPHSAQLQKMVTVQRKEKDALPGRGMAVARLLAPFWTIHVASVGFLLLRGWEGARKPFTEDTFGCLFVYICLYIHIHKTLYKKNPVVHHL